MSHVFFSEFYSIVDFQIRLISTKYFKIFFETNEPK